LLSADYSQIELRIIASISKDPGMIEAFKQGIDIHTATAAKVPLFIT
jgi:DNA polymerase-1